MTEVDQWDPSQADFSSKHEDLLRKAYAKQHETNCGLSMAEQNDLRPIFGFSHEKWLAWVREESTETIVGLIKILTLLEEKIDGFKVGSKSPVIPLFQLLRRRSGVPQDLVPWIKQHSRNRFLPYGSLADRL